MHRRRKRNEPITRLVRRLRAFPLLLGLLAGCGAPIAVPRAAHPAGDLPPALAAPITAARWVQSGGATAVGPKVASGTLVLLGGRRAVVAPDGTVRGETTPCPEALIELVEVPAQSGERRLVGRGLHGIFRFDDPLGAPTLLAHSEVELRGLGTLPGLVAVWDLQSELPRFLDLETGAPKAFTGLPVLPARAIRFLTPKEGAAIFHASGLATTVDGGTSWRPVDDAGRGDALRMNGLHVRDGALRAFLHAEGRDAAIDPAQARLGPFDEVPAPGGEPPLLRWIRITRRDPLEAAVTSGVLSPAGGAVVASHGLLARVDLTSGVLLELTEFARGNGVNACAAAQARGTAWIGCALSEENEADLYDPFGVLGISLTGQLTADRPAIARNGEAELRVSPSGGVMFVAACSADEAGDACVRQPDGRWVTFKVDVNLIERGVGPLADGRIAYVRGLYERDDPPGTDAEEDRQGPPVRAPYVVIADASGTEHRLAPSLWSGRASGDFTVQGYVQEDLDHGAHFMVSNEEGIFAFVQGPNGVSPSFQKVTAARHARLRGDHGAAVGARKLKVSLDGGRSWADVETPERVARALDQVGELDDPSAFAVTEVGTKIGSLLRLGWGPAEPAKPARALHGVTLAPRPPPAPVGPENVLTCNGGEGAAPGMPPVLGAFQIQAVLGGAAPPAKGTRRGVTSRGSGALDAIAVLEEEGPERAASPVTWTLRWLDPLELGGKAHSWSGPAPKGVAWGAILRSAAASAGRALFTVQNGSRYVLVRAKSGGGAEMVQTGFDVASNEAVFSLERDEPIAWLRDTQLYAWLAGDTPRVIGSIAVHAPRVLGQPTQDAVPVLIGGNDWAFLRAFPIPSPRGASPSKPGYGRQSAARMAARLPVPKGQALELGAPDPAAGKPSADPRAASKGVGPSLEGWTAATNVLRDAARLAACSVNPRGIKMAIARTSLGVRVDGIEESATSVVYDVRLPGGEACIASLTALVAPTAGDATPSPSLPGADATSVLDPRGGANPSGAVGPSKGTKRTTSAGPRKPMAFVRVDLASKRGEGGDRGLPKAASIRKITCSLAIPLSP